MSLEPGLRLGPYIVSTPLGAGGMGEVYRARDTRLDRDVAIKVLPAAVSSDPERLARFEREARVLASLNHPGIGAIYGLEEWNGTRALVLEIVEGPTLAERIAQGALPLDEALPIARQIAEALETAHEQGIVHRDLKPANIKLRPDGTVKVLDFGLAKALDSATASASGIGTDLSLSPTLTARATVAGIILGTAAYMAPEQAKGKSVDKRADIWAFGVVLYEMLTGRRLFVGETPSEVLAAVILKDPDLSTLKQAPAVLTRLLARCLEKDPRRRLRDIGEARLVLAEPSAMEPQRETTEPLPRASSPGWMKWVVLGLCLALAGTLVLLGRATRPAAAPVARYDVQMPRKTVLNLAIRPGIDLSRDGAALAFVASETGVSRLYVRRRDEVEARPLTGTEGASNPAFSPDGRWLAFFADNKLRKISLDGTLITLAPVNDPRGVRWSDDGAIYYTPEAIGPVHRISPEGGDSVPVTKVELAKERSHRWPELLPGGKAVLFTVGMIDSPDNYDGSNVDAVVLATGERKTVLQGANMVRYLPSGHLLFSRGGSLFAVSFDPIGLKVEGSPVNVLRGLAGDATTGASNFTYANDGTLAYVPGSKDGGLRRLFWVDRNGAAQPVDLAPGLYNDLRISHDGTRAALSVGASGSADVWVLDFGRKTFTRLTFTGINATPSWTWDSASILYAAIDQSGLKSTIFRIPADGSRQPEAVGSIDSRMYLGGVAPDNASVLVAYGNMSATGKTDILHLALRKDAKPTPISATPFDEYEPVYSPDGRWVAFQSDESSRHEVYVRDASGGGGKWQVSTEGGEEPAWSADGRELFYRSDTRFMAVPVEIRGVFQAGRPRLLFDSVYNLRADSGISYDVDPKGGRFLMLRPADEADSTSGVRVVLNWKDELARLLAAGR